ncbi:MAG: lysophospholipid acyltransferase family protein [Lachnospiraceae bacterium]|nr:lysophospholipid acyltransferase family protein [Lachnospiraceae bacterium]
MLRSILALTAAVLYCLISVPILLIETIIRKFNPEAAELSMLRIVQGAFKVILFLSGTKVTTIGLENVPSDEAVLFVGNHRSFFDVVISYSQMKNRCGYVAKDSIAKVPLLSWNMRFLSCLFLNRTDLKQGLEVIKKTIEHVQNGISVFIFPEGTRGKSENELELGEFHKGSFKTAQRTGCKIVPVSFNNTSAILEDHFPWIRRKHVVVEYGTPIAYGDLTREEQRHIDEHFRDIIAEMLKKNQALV